MHPSSTTCTTCSFVVRFCLALAQIKCAALQPMMHNISPWLEHSAKPHRLWRSIRLIRLIMTHLCYLAATSYSANKARMQMQLPARDYNAICSRHFLQTMAILSLAYCSLSKTARQSDAQIIQGVDKIVEQSTPAILVGKAQEELEEVADYFINTWPPAVLDASHGDRLNVYVKSAISDNNCSDGREWPTFMLAAGLSVQAIQQQNKGSYMPS